MKKQIAIAVLAIGAIVLGTNNLQAQNTAAAKATVNITLADVISIHSGATTGGGEVNFNYATAQDYNSDQTVSKANSLQITSTKNFDVKVKADGANFVNGTNLIPVDVVTIKAAAGGTMGGTKNDITLTTTDQTLVAKAPKGSKLTLNLDYFIPADRSSSSDILGKAAGKYTQTVTYTATAN
ncbi:peptidoglycan-binding protein LysM [Chryseobacterium taklimakanense]|uniref:peptidoglycan-binding protein LysM n=1 Tax=Chryseobacterium taklimakanense TaxID=536441 RepID=UPI001EF49145|nr:peptidoglycan-binding protein LysM [Chryseobacterium taklimakanense]MCG7280157.1 peptidoglycan-binding protein LysM [Chryseobacterium taklimakanense]